MKFIQSFAFLMLLLVGCSYNNLSKEILNQNNCARLNGDKLKIINGNILRLPNKDLLGEIILETNKTVKVFDDLNQSKIMSVVEYKKDQKRLIAIIYDESNVLLSCLVN